MTTSDLERMQKNVEGRLGSTRDTGRPRLILAVAAALALVVAVAAAALWLRGTDAVAPAVPAAPTIPQGLGPIPQVTFDRDATGSNLVALNSDGTYVYLPSERDLVHPVTPAPWTSRWRVEGNTFIRDAVNAAGGTCRGTTSWGAESDGVVRYDAPVMTGTACTSQGALPSTSTRLSPASEAGRALRPNPGAGQPVNEAIQLEGVWLLEGTGLLLAYDESVGAAVDYLLDDDGDIDTSPDGRGVLTVATPKRITLAGETCGETVLDNAMTTGANTLSSLTVTVTADPCNRFGGAKVLTWIKVL